MTEKEYWFWLCNLEQVGLSKKEKLLNYFGTPEEVYKDTGSGLEEIIQITKEERERILNSKKEKNIKESYAKLTDKGIYFVTKDDVAYPEKLLTIYQPPIALYVKGKLPESNKPSLAVIGARNCTEYGRVMAEKLAAELAGHGLQIISGLAHGIDGYAHKGALSAGGLTYGIEGCGVDICYPKENFHLYMEMIHKGGVISEYAPGCPPRPYHFPLRNRIISGLSDGILVIEAKEKSGSFITVDLGLDEGKNIYALPGRALDPLSIGCNNLIKMGAKLVTGVQDILEDFSITYENYQKDLKKNDKLLETKEKIVYSRLSFLPKHINELTEETKLSIGDLSEILINLEINNYIKQTRTNYYVLI
ncbi:DNA processing protein DprA [Anaerocolumna cellulosilytica]|uniref:DNA processing protein DprA n=1 Tax=Anaerocolumna cellulosilytica TaxID=433286 RepID=A0A6S6QZQ1_9FIRM|nr:DNA-processing protein DprA [Anaerocolumna cellulosilytica]MBB5197042.1 DNA processing protein [Anaerocolumna cellulosilytica]BCJ95256.1 DNA processing protein DprA [Anaerocolumna cellulosilytica]